MTRETFIASLRQGLAGLPEPERPELVSGGGSQFGYGPVARPSEAGRQRCWREFAGAVHAIWEESSHDS